MPAHPPNSICWAEAAEIALMAARGYCRNPDQAQDVAQEAMVRIWRFRHSLREPRALAAWIRTIVRREADRAASARPQSEFFELGHDADVRDPISGADARLDVLRAIDGLTQHEQALLALRYDGDLTQAAIAARLGLPEGTVKVQLHRAREQLRSALASYDSSGQD